MCRYEKAPRDHPVSVRRSQEFRNPNRDRAPDAAVRPGRGLAGRHRADTAATAAVPNHRTADALAVHRLEFSADDAEPARLELVDGSNSNSSVLRATGREVSAVVGRKRRTAKGEVPPSSGGRAHVLAGGGPGSRLGSRLSASCRAPTAFRAIAAVSARWRPARPRPGLTAASGARSRPL
jgi:hypothetical protein